MSDELVLVVPTASVVAELGGGRPWLGILGTDARGLSDLISRVGVFRSRVLVETDESWKQVIPYVILRDGPRWFLMRRTRAGSDARLHERYSIGVGGHVNPEDGALDGNLTGALRREWFEELAVDFVPEFACVGLLNDDTTEVGRVHLGVVHVGDAGGRPVSIREVDKLSGSFVDEGEVLAVTDQLETWSRLAAGFLVGSAVR
jgi:predicted NUDIX family phosphoesterase